MESREPKPGEFWAGFSGAHRDNQMRKLEVLEALSDGQFRIGYQVRGKGQMQREVARGSLFRPWDDHVSQQKEERAEADRRIALQRQLWEALGAAAVGVDNRVEYIYLPHIYNSSNAARLLLTQNRVEKLIQGLERMTRDEGGSSLERLFGS